TIRDFDFRRRLDYELAGKAHGGKGVEGRLEQYHYHPGSLAHDSDAAALAQRSLEAQRALEQVVSYRTTVLDLAPGTVFSIGGHARARIAAPHELLAVERAVEGGAAAELTVTGRAALAAVPHRPDKHTRRPRISGVQSAIVVGPEGEEI